MKDQKNTKKFKNYKKQTTKIVYKKILQSTNDRDSYTKIN